MKRILITGIGGDVAQAVAAIIREKDSKVCLIGSDIHTEHGGRLYVDEALVLPRASDSNYCEKLEAVLRAHEVDVIVPMTEPELEVFDAGAVNPGLAVVAMPRSPCFRQCLDKLETNRMLAGLGLAVPWTVDAAVSEPRAYPCIFKSRRGSGSRSVHIVESESQARYLAGQYPNGVFQELLLPADREVTCAVYRDRQGRVHVLQMLRRLVGGFTGWARIIEDEAVHEACVKVAQGMDLYGSINIQLRCTESGPRIFEINPRFSSTTLMRHRSGYTDVLWALAELEDKAVGYWSVQAGTEIVRVQSAAVLN